MNSDERYDGERMPMERGRTALSAEVTALIRQRVETRYYERPDVMDAVARAILRCRAMAG